MERSEIWKILVIGVIEGITEWLPISSTGHMLLLDAVWPLQLSEAFKEVFFVVIQLGAILAVVTVFWDRLWPFENKTIRPAVLKLWQKVVIGCLPAGVLGLLLDDVLEAHFGTPVTIALMLIAYGIAFLIIEHRPAPPVVTDTDSLSARTACLIGFFQALAMIPGTSRSGATIIGGLLLGVSRTAASEFSFFLAVPTMLGASCLKLMKFGFSFTPQELAALLSGMAVAYLVSILSVRFLLEYVRLHSFKPFGWYRIVLGATVLAATWHL